MKTNRFIMSHEQMRSVWQNASWERVVDIFGLEADRKRRTKPDEVWIKSPFTNEGKASLHLNLSRNIFKDFSSGRGAQKGILNFCQELLSQRGLNLNCYEVAKWMVENGISTTRLQQLERNQRYNKADIKKRDEKEKKESSKVNRPIKTDLRPWLRSDHPALERRGISKTTCQYLGCGYLLARNFTKKQSPLNDRIVFQIRGIFEDQKRLKSTILTHTGRALTKEQEERDGKYWSFPFYKGLEIYNQDKLILDKDVRCQLKEFGLVLVEGFYDVVSLVEAGCLNVGALMGSQISKDQITRLKFIAANVEISKINLFLDRDKAGYEGAQKTYSLLNNSGFQVDIFNWDQTFFNSKMQEVKISEKIKDPGDMSANQLLWLRGKNKI